MRHFFLVCMTLAVGLFVACGSGGSDAEQQTQEPERPGMVMEKDPQLKSSEDWIRSQPIDVKSLDLNQDGFLYQDAMDWNVIADEKGRCPKCGMFLTRVTVDEAVKNLKDNGYTVK